MIAEQTNRRLILIAIGIAAALVMAGVVVELTYFMKSPQATSIETANVGISNSAFQPSLMTLTVGHNATVSFVDEATNPPFLKLASLSPWPAGSTPIVRLLTYGENYTMALNIPGVYHFYDAESSDQGNITIRVIG